jgi:hypothetical protein
MGGREPASVTRFVALSACCYSLGSIVGGDSVKVFVEKKCSYSNAPTLPYYDVKIFG